MAYVSLYRKYRSQTFGDLVGQDHVVKTVQAGIKSERIAHAYLFTGPRGTGKTSTARLLAKALCCENGPTPEPDNTCAICEAITIGACIDVVEMDAASESGVDEVREKIVEVTEYRPMMARYKVFIIDEVHDLSAKAFDALLKTIEEPPAHVIFILATTEYNKVPPTIRSRCQKFEFHRATMADLVGRLRYVAESEGLQIEPRALTAIARMADGGYRDALTLLEQAMLTSDGTITVEGVYDQLGMVSEEAVDGLISAMKDADIAALIEQVAEITRLGRDPRSILESMLHRLGDLTRASYQLAGSGDASQEAAMHEAAARFGRDFLLRLRGGLAEAHKTIRDISLPRLWLESELIRLALLKQSAPAPVIAAAPAAAPAPPVSRPTPAPQISAPPVTHAAPIVVDYWTSVVAEMNGMSKTLGMKLEGSKVTDDDGNRVVVEIIRPAFHEWLESRPKAVTEIRNAIRKHRGAHYEVQLTIGGEVSSVGEVAAAVELPLDGQRLEDIAREILETKMPDPGE